MIREGLHIKSLSVLFHYPQIWNPSMSLLTTSSSSKEDEPASAFLCTMHHSGVLPISHDFCILFYRAPLTKDPFPSPSNMLRLPIPQKQKGNLPSSSTSLQLLHTDKFLQSIVYTSPLLLHLLLAVHSISPWDYSKMIKNKHGAALGSLLFLTSPV